MKLPGYEIEVLLGKGGMASVYQARQQSFNREVALKVYSHIDDAEDSEAGFGQRFMQESQIIAKLHHSHIVQVYDVGKFENNYYISMEYLHGGNLADKIAEGITLKESVTIIRQAASALEFAHRKRIIHRDIKPENMMFREDGALVLTDFGIAKELESQSNLTQTGLVIGTPKYMSPEQIRGDDVDHRTDIYALGIVFFRCLTNYLPFDGKDIVVTSYLQHNEPVPKLPDQVACFQPIINRMLAKDPEERYQKAMDVASALDRLDTKFYRAELTNLDVAAANEQFPPTVKRSTSGSFTTKAVAHTPTQSLPPTHLNSGNESKPAIRRKITDFEDTLELSDSRSGESLDLEDWRILDAPAPSRPKGGARLLGLAISVAIGLGAYQYMGNEFRHYWNVAYSHVQEQWNSIRSSGDSVVAIVKEDASPKVPKINERLSEQLKEPVEPEQLLDDAAFAKIHQLLPAELAMGYQSTIELQLEDLPMQSPLPAVIDPLALAADSDEGAEPYSDEVVQNLLAAAQLDLDEWRLTKPQSSNALDKYLQVLEIQPDNQEAAKGIEEIGRAYLRLVDRAILEQNFDRAERFLTSAQKVSPGLSEINAIRGRLSIAEEAYEEAKILDLALQQAQQVEFLLSAAQEDEQAGRIRSPAGNNALEKYQQILALDPDNTTAISKLVDFGR